MKEKTRFLGVRKSMVFEDCDYVFMREDINTGEVIEIMFNMPTILNDNGSWQQWGAPEYALYENVADIQRFLHHKHHGVSYL